MRTYLHGPNGSSNLGILRYLFMLSLLSWVPASAQSDTSGPVDDTYPLRRLTLEPAIGINPYPSADLLISGLVQWNSSKRLGIVSYTSYAYNNAFQRTLGHVKNDYNYSLSQKFGIGTSRYGKRTAHSLALLAGVKYDAFKETLEDPDLADVTASVKTVSPDVGLMYSLKVGRQKYYFSYRMYIPLYPYPIKTLDLWSMDGNLANISLEFGVGVRLK